MERYFNRRKFVESCRYGFNMESYAEMHISESEILDLIWAGPDPYNPEVYVAEYGVLDDCGHQLRSITVNYNTVTEKYWLQ